MIPAILTAAGTALIITGTGILVIKLLVDTGMIP